MARGSERIKRARADALLDELNGSKGLDVLDVGCQDGALCARLAKAGHVPVGVEIVEGLVSRARERHPDLRFELADCEARLPFPDEAFDVVWAGDVIEHIRWTDVFVNEINRVLRTGGRVILTTPFHNRLKSTLIALLRFEKHFDPEFPHYRFYTRKSLEDVLARRGFLWESHRLIGRVPVVANTILAIATKSESKAVMSEHRH